MRTIWSDHTDEALIERARQLADESRADAIPGMGYREMYRELADRLELLRGEDAPVEDQGSPEKWSAPPPLPFEPFPNYVMRVMESMEVYVNGQA